MFKALQNKLLIVTTGSWFDLLIHICLAMAITAITGMLFINSYLPSVTHHGQVITVPDLTGMSVNEAERFLRTRGMDYVVSDTSYSRKHKLNVVLSQTPSAGEKVKQGRRIALTINPKDPPKKKVPKLDGEQIDDVRRILENANLEIGRINYKPDFGKDVVLEFYINGRKMDSATIAKGYFVPVDTKVDLLVADGRGETEFNVPDLTGLSEEEAEEVAKAHEITLHKQYDYKSRRELGTVTWQNPPTHIGTVRRGKGAGGNGYEERERNKIRAGDLMDIRIAGNPAAKPMTDEERYLYEQKKDSLERNINMRTGKDLNKRYKNWEEENKNKKPTDKKDKTDKSKEKEKETKPKTNPKEEPKK